MAKRSAMLHRLNLYAKFSLFEARAYPDCAPDVPCMNMSNMHQLKGSNPALGRRSCNCFRAISYLGHSMSDLVSSFRRLYWNALDLGASGSYVD